MRTSFSDLYVTNKKDQNMPSASILCDKVGVIPRVLIDLFQKIMSSVVAIIGLPNTFLSFKFFLTFLNR